MKKAFTMLELIFVLIVIGILAAVIMPRMERNPVYEAGVQLLSHIRYTQHLALVDDKYDATDPNWFQEKWQIMFENTPNSNNTWSYTIFADTDHNGTASTTEIATNPQDKSKKLTGGTGSINFETSAYSPAMNLGHKYGIDNVVVTGGGGSTDGNDIVLFDNMGRAFKHSSNTLASITDGLAVTPIFVKICQGACSANNKISTSDNELVIRIENETGYSCILQQNSDFNCTN
jgi:prepilin-type N-terminal cleavage/methylation domain-containing protein